MKTPPNVAEDAIRADERQKTEEWVCQRMVDWLHEKPRRPATTAFTAGPMRDLAYTFEEKLRGGAPIPAVSNAFEDGPWPDWRRLKKPPYPGWEHYKGPDGMEIFCSPNGLGNRAFHSPPSTRPWWGIRRQDEPLKGKNGQIRVFATPEAVKKVLERM